VTTLPALASTAAPRQDTSKSPLEPSTSVAVSAALPPVGFVDVTMLPTPSPSTQRLVVGQDTPHKASAPSASVAVQVGPPPRVGTLGQLRSGQCEHENRGVPRPVQQGTLTFDFSLIDMTLVPDPTRASARVYP